MTKKLTHEEAREILLKGGMVNAFCQRGFVELIQFDNARLCPMNSKKRFVDIESYNYFTEYKEPVKYSVDIWLDTNNPKPGGGYCITNYLFGAGMHYWSEKRTDTCTHKFRIIVEEVAEND